MIQRNQNNCGLTLIELLVYMIIFTLLMNMVYLTFNSANALNRKAQKYLINLQNAMLALEDIKSKVRSAVTVVDSYREYNSGPTTLIIQSNDRKYHIYKLEDEYIQRLTFSEGNAQNGKVQIRRFLVKCESPLFEYDTLKPHNARLVSVTLRLKREKQQGELKANFTTKICLRNVKQGIAS